jgi:hypothetical protein
MAKGSHCNFSYETPTEIGFFLKQLLLTNAGEILIPLDHPQRSQNPQP